MGIVGFGRITGPQTGRWKRPGLQPLAGCFPVLVIDPLCQLQCFGTLAAFSKQEPDLRICAVLLPVFWLAVLKAWRTMRVDAAAQLLVAVLAVQPFCEPIAHIPIKLRSQFGDGQNTLEIARRALQDHGWLEAPALETLQTYLTHVVNEDMMPVLGLRCVVDIFASCLKAERACKKICVNLRQHLASERRFYAYQP